MISLLLPHLVRESARHDVPTVDLSSATENNYYSIAHVLMDGVDWFLKLIGQGDNQTLFIWIYSAVVLGISLVIGWAVQWFVLLVVTKLSKHWRNDIYTRLTQAHFFTKASRFIPAIVFLIFIQFTLTSRATLAAWLTRITWIYVIYIVASALSTLAMVLWSHLDARENKKKLPLKGLVQLIKGLIWIMAVIIVIAILVNKSPGSLLAGLGAFAAVLMLVFKDSILGVVAGVQLSENDSLHVGDWIKVSGTDANGIVTEVSLTAVKVQNFDKTVTTVPPYNLVSGSFTNYRPMQESGTRRIQRYYMIDADSIVPTTDEMLSAFAKVPLMADWINKKLAQRAAGKVEDVNNSEGLVDGSLDTNLGIFRAYLKMYLDSSEYIDHNASVSECFVRTLDQTANGIPLQIYCFTNTSKWIPYEAIQSRLFEHIAIMLAKFRLYTYENASGRDEVINGVLEAGANPNKYFGIPYPFYVTGGNPENPGAEPASTSAPLSPQSPSK
ncbi:MAG: mechanosensitive ion channel family protein [Muribaculaceae bacterium]|nr:mechanosensitive ion channel family protein [Muribaculaceae bacterium]